jgi:hypothetical protein
VEVIKSAFARLITMKKWRVVADDLLNNPGGFITSGPAQAELWYERI